MPVPPLTLQHLKTSRQYKGATLINRYWFQWQNRRNLSALVPRLDLLDDTGKVLSTSSGGLPKTKVTGTVPSDNSPVFIKIDDVAMHQATQFRYYVVTGIMSKSESITASMKGVSEDLSMHG